MKAILSVLFATFLATMAPAVTMNWTGTGTWKPSALNADAPQWRNLTGGRDDANQLASGQKAAFRMGVTLSAVPTKGCLFGIGGYDTYGNPNKRSEVSLLLGPSDFEAIVGKTPLDMAVPQTMAPLKTGYNEIVIAIDRADGAASNISIFVNGTEVFALTNQDLTGVCFAAAFYGRSVTNGTTNVWDTSVATKDVDVAWIHSDSGYEGISAIRDSYGLLPEPTALALLALGAGAVLLRRRIA